MLFLLACLVPLAYATAPPVPPPVQEHFSFPPNNTPVSKVYVFGKPIYVRQPFVLPSRVERSGMGSLVNFESQDAAVVRRDVSMNVIPGQPEFPATTAPKAQNRGNAPGFQPQPAFPLPQCYTTKSGFMCCNTGLEKVIEDTYFAVKAEGRSSCNTQSLVNRIQKACQKEFEVDFEALVGVGDFASKAHFWSDLICKTEIEGRFLMAYATPGRFHPPPTTTTTTTTTTTPPPQDQEIAPYSS